MTMKLILRLMVSRGVVVCSPPDAKEIILFGQNWYTIWAQNSPQTIWLAVTVVKRRKITLKLQENSPLPSGNTQFFLRGGGGCTQATRKMIVESLFCLLSFANLVLLFHSVRICKVWEYSWYYLFKLLQVNHFQCIWMIQWQMGLNTNTCFHVQQNPVITDIIETTNINNIAIKCVDWSNFR